MLTDLTKFGRREVVPMLEDFAAWLGENQDEIRSTASEIGGNLVPVLETAGDVLGLAVDAAKALPEPLRGIVLQAGLAALALPKVSAAATTMNASIGNTVTPAPGRREAHRGPGQRDEDRSRDRRHGRSDAGR